MNITRPIFVGEISANHLGDFERAKNLVQAVIDAGVHAVKFQTYTADTMTIDSDLPGFKISNDHKLWGGRKLHELYQEAHTPWSWHPELFEICRRNNVIPFSTPFDLTAVDFLESLNCPMYKISSMETGDHALIKRVAETGKPVIISTGATMWNEIEELVAVFEKTGNNDLTLLLCTSSYPADPIDVHLRRMQLLRDRFETKVGLSDHTLGIGVSVAAIALGASVIEKHVTLRRADGGADAAFSLEPEELRNLIFEGNAAHLALGSPVWNVQDSESESRRIRRSLYVVEDVKAGETVTSQNVRAIRPGGGALPKFLDSFIGGTFKIDAVAGTPMESSLLRN